MNYLCASLLRELKAAAQKVLREDQQGESLRKSLAKIDSKKSELRDELIRLQKSLKGKRYRIERRKKDNDELLALDCTQEDRAELEAARKEIQLKLDEVDKEQAVLDNYCEKCEVLIEEVNISIQSYVSSPVTSVIDEEPLNWTVEDLNVYSDVNNKGCLLVHLETNSGSFLCVMHDRLPDSCNEVSCEFTRIIYMHKTALQHLDAIAGIKNVAELSVEENARLTEFNSAIDPVRSKLRRMLVNTKAGKPTTLQLPMSQPVHDIHERYSELAWSLARGNGFTVLLINHDDPYVHSGEALRQGAFKMPDDSGRIVCVGVMTFIFPKLSKVTLTEANMANGDIKAPDEIVSAVFNVKEQKWSDPVFRSQERHTLNEKSGDQPPQVTLLLGALDQIEGMQEKLLGLTGRLKAFVKNL